MRVSGKSLREVGQLFSQQPRFQASQPAYLVSCFKPDLLSLVQREDPLISGKTVVQVMAAIRRLAVSGGSGNK